ncbi:conserved hypothetical protein [Mesorhizobium sp. SOD10]|nr:conserved hypothetical protein [Mesorhizobium sp. SOD10]
MYLKHILAINSGPLADIDVQPEFTSDGLPKPLIFVGRNGAGKTNLLSIIADAIIEIAAQHFSDITPPNAGGRAFFRVVGGTTIRIGAPFELAACKFHHDDAAFYYRAKAGRLNPADVAQRMEAFPGVGGWDAEQNEKVVTGPHQQIEKIFRSGCYSFFPSNRAELPFWANNVNDEPAAIFRDRYFDKLRKPITVAAAIGDLLPWIIDVILDQSLDAVQYATSGNLAPLLLQAALQNNSALQNINAIVRTIIAEPQARIVRTGRSAGTRKIQIAVGNDIIFPSLNSLSAGQVTLFSIFATILRYADTGQTVSPAQQMEGIVIVDEIDAHLHADLQHRVLPALMRLFPKIQFIVSSHSPLFPLGMAEAYGEAGFSLIELPSATKITAERFTEFLDSFRYFQATKSFEEEVASRAAKAERPFVLCEGETDPRYLRAAAGLLGFGWLLDQIEIDWVGRTQPGGAVDGGKAPLAQAAKVLRNNPQFVKTPTVLAFDFDSAQPQSDYDNLHIRTFPENPNNQVCRSGIENLLPETAFEDRFYETVTKRTADVTKISKLRKKELCEFLCDERKNPDDFAGFRPVLEMLADALGLTAPNQPSSEAGAAEEGPRP